jgi:hypothetical protein
MAEIWYAVRFFRVVPPVARLMVLSFACVAAVAAAALASDPGRGARAVIPIVVLQLFAVSAGFAVSARRGYYDLLLTSGTGRVRTALVHWVMSMAPGVVSWVALGLFEAAVSGNHHGIMASGTAAAMFVVSTVPWALTVALPRFAGAIGWMLLCVMAVTLTPIGDQGGAAWRASLEDQSWTAAAAFLLFPIRLVGEDVLNRLGTVTPGMAFAAAAMAMALIWIHRTNLPLEAAQ